MRVCIYDGIFREEQGGMSTAQLVIFLSCSASCTCRSLPSEPVLRSQVGVPGVCGRLLHQYTNATTTGCASLLEWDCTLELRMGMYT